MLRTPLGVDTPSASGSEYIASLVFDTAARAKYIRVGDIVEDKDGEKFTILWWTTYPDDFVSGGFAVLGGETTPAQSLATDDSIVYTSGQLNVRPGVSIDGSIATSSDTGSDDGQNYERLITATWTSASEGNAATTGDHVIDSTGKAYVITEISNPGSSQWASGVVVTELEKEGVAPQVGSAYLYRPTTTLGFYQGKVLSTTAEDYRRNRDEFTTAVSISGLETDIGVLTTDLYPIITSGDGFGDVFGPSSATDNSLAVFDGATGKLIKEVTIGSNNLVLTASGGEVVWAAAQGGGGGGGSISGPGSSTDNAIVRWNGVAGNTIQDSSVTVSDSGIISLPAGVVQSITNASGTSIFNVQNSDWLVRVDSQGQAVTVNMPPAPVNGQVHNIKDGNGLANINNITITPNTGQIIDAGASTLVLNLAYQSVELIWVEDPGVWHII